MSSQPSDTAEHDTSFLDRAIDSVEDGVQIVMEIPAKSLLNKTLDIVEDGVEILRKFDDGKGFNNLKENPVDTILTKTMESLGDAVIHNMTSAMQDNTDDGYNDDEKSTTSKPIIALVEDASELIDIAKKSCAW